MRGLVDLGIEALDLIRDDSNGEKVRALVALCTSNGPGDIAGTQQAAQRWASPQRAEQWLKGDEAYSISCAADREVFEAMQRVTVLHRDTDLDIDWSLDVQVDTCQSCAVLGQQLELVPARGTHHLDEQPYPIVADIGVQSVGHTVDEDQRRLELVQWPEPAVPPLLLTEKLMAVLDMGETPTILDGQLRPIVSLQCLVEGAVPPVVPALRVTMLAASRHRSTAKNEWRVP